MVLYRYNAVRNDYVGQRIKMKKYTQGDEDGFYIPKTIAGVRIVSNRKEDSNWIR
jgi:hypothetical protein